MKQGEVMDPLEKVKCENEMLIKQARWFQSQRGSDYSQVPNVVFEVAEDEVAEDDGHWNQGS